MQWEEVERHLQAGKKHREMIPLLNLSRPRISNLARLIKLPDPIKDMMRRGVLSQKHAETLLELKPAAQLTMASEAIRYQWSVVQLRANVKKAKGRQVGDEVNENADIASMERELGELLGTDVRIDNRTDGTGWLKVRFTDNDTLDGVLRRLGYQSY